MDKRLDEAFLRGFVKAAMGGYSQQRPMPLQRPLPTPPPPASARTLMPSKPPMMGSQMGSQQMGGGDPRMAQVMQLLRGMPMTNQQRFAGMLNKRFDTGNVMMNPTAHL